MGEQRDLRRKMEKEIKKGSCPLRFEKIEIPENAYKQVLSKKDLVEAMDYLFRMGKFKVPGNTNVTNNLYMDYDFIRKSILSMKRTKSFLDRSELRQKILIREKWMKPDYAGGKVFTESIKCYFKFDEEELQKYKFTYAGKETYAFPMSEQYMIYLHSQCEEARRKISEEMIEESGLDEKYKDIVNLTNVKDGIFKSLLLDDIHYEDGYFTGYMRSILIIK